MDCSLSKSERKEVEGFFYERKWVMHRTVGRPVGAVLTPNMFYRTEVSRKLREIHIRAFFSKGC